jgi:hypothetical protein
MANSCEYIFPNASYAVFYFNLIKLAASQFNGESSFGFDMSSLRALHKA